MVIEKAVYENVLTVPAKTVEKTIIPQMCALIFLRTVDEEATKPALYPF